MSRGGNDGGNARGSSKHARITVDETPRCVNRGGGREFTRGAGRTTSTVQSFDSREHSAPSGNELFDRIELIRNDLAARRWVNIEKVG